MLTGSALHRSYLNQIPDVKILDLSEWKAFSDYNAMKF